MLLIAGHWTVKEGWVLKRPFHTNEKAVNTLDHALSCPVPFLFNAVTVE